MLQIKVPITAEQWNEETQEFIEPKYKVLQLEHSLVSLSKWESKWHKAFLSNKEKTDEELLDYVKDMTITQNVEPEVYEHLTAGNYKEINDYIGDPMSATFISDNGQTGSGGAKEIVTSELIYYWMIALNIPVKFEKWHLNRLITLIRVCELKTSPPKKRSRGEIMRQNAILNAARKKQLNTNG